MRQVGNEVLDDPHIGERVDRCRRSHLGNKPRTGQPVGAVHVHCARAADTLSARASESQRRVHLALDPEERIENHRSAIVEIDMECIEAGIATRVGIIAIDLERLRPHRAGRGRPRPPRLNARFRRDLEVSRNGKSLEQRDARYLIRGFNDHGVSPALGEPVRRRMMTSRRLTNKLDRTAYVVKVDFRVGSSPCGKGGARGNISRKAWTDRNPLVLGMKGEINIHRRGLVRSVTNRKKQRTADPRFLPFRRVRLHCDVMIWPF